MSEAKERRSRSVRGMVQATIRIRGDQRMRLERELRARGGTLADVIRDNLDLAFAIKSELAKIVEGEYDENDPKNAPRLVHTLLFRVEERILSALDGISRQLARKGSGALKALIENEALGETIEGKRELVRENYVAELVNGFINLLSRDSKHGAEVWVGAFLEITSRLELLSETQLADIKNRGELWLEEQGYYPTEGEIESEDMEGDMVKEKLVSVPGLFS